MCGRVVRAVCAASMAVVGPVGAGFAQEVLECDWRSSARNLVEPWEDNTQTYSNGAVRLALLDLGEPAVAAMYVLVISPPYDELGTPQCRVIGWVDGLGFGAVYLKELRADYDPSRGLTFTIPAMLVLEDGFSNPVEVIATLNQATGDISTELILGPE